MTSRSFSIFCAVVLVAVLGANRCMAQSNDSQTITNWGESVKGVRLSIKMATNVFQVGSSTTVESMITNSSTNAITVDISAPALNFDVLLTNNIGQLYHIITPMLIRTKQKLVAITPGNIIVETIPVTFGENIEPGNYMIKAKLHFALNGKQFTVESNSIKVQVTK